MTRSFSSNGNPVCRTFDETVTTGAGETETNRYTACQSPNGEVESWKPSARDLKFAR